jgi:hypothetical protein
MSGVLAVEQGSTMLYEFRSGHVTSLVSSQACRAGGDGRVGLGMVPRVVSVRPWWGTRLGVRVVSVVGPE